MGTINRWPLISSSRQAADIGSVPTVEHSRPLGDTLKRAANQEGSQETGGNGVHDQASAANAALAASLAALTAADAASAARLADW